MITNNDGEAGGYIPRFNAALRELSQQLRTLHISGMFPVHPTLFYPPDDEVVPNPNPTAAANKGTNTNPKPPLPSWPHLRSLKIQSTLHREDGRS